MSEELFISEGVYRIVDGIYRLHRDLFEIENAITRTTILEMRLGRIKHDGQMGVIVAGLLVIVPILISLGKIEWGSAPAITIFGIAGAVLLLWACQILAARKVSNELAILEGCCSTDDLEGRFDFVLEETNAWVNRYKLALSIVEQLIKAEHKTTAEARAQLHSQRVRYEEIAQSCEDYIGTLIQTSERLVRANKRSKDAHEELLDWAAAIPKFANRSSR